MSFTQRGPLRFFQFETLVHPELEQAIFTRQGGVSPEPWDSLNLGGTVGDKRERVLENKRRVLEAAGRRVSSLYEVWQVHSADVVVVEAPLGEGELVRADAVISANPEVTLLMRFADCVPILLFDPKVGAVGLVHAGWLGTVRKTVAAAVRAMQSAFGSRPEDLRAGLGPSIGPDHYPIGKEVVAQARESFGAEAERHLQANNGQVRFDLWSANRSLLEAEGVTSIEVAGLCTACHPEDWYSHRGQAGRTGRFGALIALHA